MKHKKLFSLFMIILCFTLTAFFVSCGNSSCGKDNNTLPGIKVDGSDNAGDYKVYSIIGAKDIMIKKGETIDGYTSLVKAVNGNELHDVTIDASNVDLNVSGEYKLVYSYDEASVAVNVFVYDLPTIADSNANNVVEIEYTTAFLDAQKGITAFAKLGEKQVPLEIKMIDNELFRTDGSIDVSDKVHTITYFAQDPAGQIVSVIRQVKLIGGMPVIPSITDYLKYDVLHDTFTIKNIDKDTYDSFLTVSIDGRPLSLETDIHFEYKEGTNDYDLVFSGDSLYYNFGVNNNLVLRFITSNGYSESTLDIVDEMPVALDDSNLNSFIKVWKISGEEYVIPEVYLTCPRQNAEISYRLLKGDKQVPVTNNEVVFEDAGKYTLEYTIDGKIYSYDLTCYNDIGLKGSTVFTSENKFGVTFDEGVSLIRYTVKDGENIVAYYDIEDKKYNSLDSFYQTVEDLNKSKVYALTAVVSDGLKLKSQTIDFTVADENILEIISGDGSHSRKLLTPYAPGKSNLNNYVYSDIAQRYGSYVWKGNAEISQEDSILKFERTIAEKMKAGTYFTFDIYCPTAINLALYDSSSVNAFYTTAYNAQRTTDICVYIDGQKHVLDASTSLSNLGYIGKWITIEVKFNRDFGNGKLDGKYNGLFVIGNSSAQELYKEDFYLSNVKFSTYSFMSDTTKNQTIVPSLTSEGYQDDIWKD